MSHEFRIIAGEARQVGEEKDRTLRIYGTDESPDRYNSVIRVDGWVMDNFRKNPIFLWCHDSQSPPIGRIVNYGTTEEKRDARQPLRRMFFDVQFADQETYPFADIIYKLYKKGFMRATSVGFDPISTREVTDEKELAELGLRGPVGVVYTKQELFELSAVPVPGNPNALVDELGALVPACRALVLNADGSTPGEAEINEAWLKQRLESVRLALDPAADMREFRVVTTGGASSTSVELELGVLDPREDSPEELMEPGVGDAAIGAHPTTLDEEKVAAAILANTEANDDPPPALIELLKRIDQETDAQRDERISAAVQAWNDGEGEDAQRAGFTCPKPFESHAACVSSMGDKVDDPDAFCAAWARHCGEKAAPEAAPPDGRQEILDKLGEAQALIDEALQLAIVQGLGENEVEEAVAPLADFFATRWPAPVLELVRAELRRAERSLLPCLNGMAKRSELSAVLVQLAEVQRSVTEIKEARANAAGAPAPKGQGAPERKGDGYLDRVLTQNAEALRRLREIEKKTK